MGAFNKAENLDIIVRRQVMNAVRKLQGENGVSLRDLKKYLKDSKKIDIISNDVFIKFSLKRALDRGILARDDGNYKAANVDSTVRRQVMNAVHKLQGKNGVSLRDLKKFLKDSRKMDVASNDVFIKLSLKKTLDRGILTRDDGNYKIVEAKRRRSKKRKSSPKRGRSKRRSKRRSSKRKSSGKRRRRRKSPKSAAAE